MKDASKVRCFDNGGKTFDRYTAVFPPVEGRWTYLAMSDDPFHPQGFGQHGELSQRPGTHLGRRIAINELPEKCQKLIRMELEC